MKKINIKAIFSYKKCIFEKSKIISLIGFFKLFHLEYLDFQNFSKNFKLLCKNCQKKWKKPVFSTFFHEKYKY